MPTYLYSPMAGQLMDNRISLQPKEADSNNVLKAQIICLTSAEGSFKAAVVQPLATESGDTLKMGLKPQTMLRVLQP